MIVTCRELAEIFGIDYLQASSVVKLLIKTGTATEIELVKGEGRGRPTVRYAIPSKATINFVTGEVKNI